jgi:hypothetical protein
MMMMIIYMYLPIDRLAVRLFCMLIIVSYSHISLHVLPTLPCILLTTFLLSSMSCHATRFIIIERSDKGVTEWLRQPHVLSSLFFNDNDLLPSSLPPVLLLFLLISSRLMITASPSLSFFFPLVRLCLIPVVSCLCIVSFHG